MSNLKKQPPQNNRLLLKYLGFGMQLMLALALMVFLGLKSDKWLSFKYPLLVWILPLLVILVAIYQAIKDTSKKSNV